MCIIKLIPLIISIHALLAESDAKRFTTLHDILISIHALLAESDPSITGYFFDAVHFYPRSPCGERHGRADNIKRNKNFYPRSPCGERLTLIQKIAHLCLISIHALLAESDVEKVPADVYYQAFLSTLSLRRATIKRRHKKHLISHFYPRSPCGERPVKFKLDFINQEFLSTLSLRRATSNGWL